MKGKKIYLVPMNFSIAKINEIKQSKNGSLWEPSDSTMGFRRGKFEIYGSQVTQPWVV